LGRLFIQAALFSFVREDDACGPREISREPSEYDPTSASY
jgi:hypothetical protein